VTCTVDVKKASPSPNGVGEAVVPVAEALAGVASTVVVALIDPRIPVLLVAEFAPVFFWDLGSAFSRSNNEECLSEDGVVGRVLLGTFSVT
jgi:hypothetical protein